MAEPAVITTLPVSPDDDRRRRMAVYAFMMLTRFGCFVAMFFVEGWVQLACFLGALLLPYFAVIRANAPAPAQASSPERPNELTTE